MPEYRRTKIEGGTYFFTVNTYHRQPILTDALVRQALREGIDRARQTLPFKIEAWVLLPDHLHLYLDITTGGCEFLSTVGDHKATRKQALR